MPTDPERPDYEFEVPDASGIQKRAFFEVADDDTSLYYGRSRFHRVD